MITPNKVAAFVCVDYADKHTNQDTRRCRFIAHTADLSALIGINSSYFLTCHHEHNRVILAIPARVILSEAKDLCPGVRSFASLRMTLSYPYSRIIDDLIFTSRIELCNA